MFEFIRRDSKPANKKAAHHNAERDHAQAALARAVVNKDRAAEQRCLVQLQTLEPNEPRWPHKLGDLLRRMGHAGDAALAYRRAGELYCELGFAGRAEAMTRVARTLSGRSGPLVAAHPSLRPDPVVTPNFELSFAGRRLP